MYLQNCNVLFINTTHRNPLCVYQRLRKGNGKAFKCTSFIQLVSILLEVVQVLRDRF